MTPAPAAARAGWAAPAAIIAVFGAALAFYWNGLGPGDAEHYLEAALRWREGPFLGDTHWALRHLFVLPIAASFAVFGVSETAAILPNAAYAALTVFITWHFGRRFLGARAATIAAMLVATSAFFVARPIELDVYGAEAFFAALAVWLFIAAGDGKARLRTLFGAGAVAGLASTVREPSVYLIAVFGALILLERKEGLRSLVAVGAGFGAVIAVELIVYALAAGDPLFRYKIDLGHRDIGVNAAMTSERAAISARAARALTFLATTPATTPMLVLGCVALFYLRAARTAVTGAGARALRVFGAAAVLSAMSAPLVFNVSATRYYPLLTYACFLVAGVALAALWAGGRPRAAMAAGFVVVAVNVAAADFMRDDSYTDARRLAALAAASAEPIYADPLTAYRARYQLRLQGMTEEAAEGRAINARYAGPGALFLKTSRTPQLASHACVIEAFATSRRRWTHRVIESSGAGRLFGGRMEEAVAPPQPAYLVRFMENPQTDDPISGKPCLRMTGA